MQYRILLFINVVDATTIIQSFNNPKNNMDIIDGGIYSSNNILK